jgi:hypothetical protein
MSLKKILPLIIIIGVILAVPAQVMACPTYNNKTKITIDSVDVSDYDGDGLKEDAFLQGGVTFYSNRPQSNVRCTITYYLVYLPDGTYTGDYTYGTSWVMQKTYRGFSSSPEGAVNAYSYNIDNLPYPGWYSVKAVVKMNGQTAVSNTFIFDPPGGGGPGPIGR